MVDPKLYTLLAAAELGSFTKAAEKLGLTQTAVSQQIKLMETDLDCVLFLRAERPLKLTPEGDLAVKYARRIAGVYDRMKQAMVDEKTRLTRITVGITHTSESNPVAEVLARYGSQNEGVRITILSDTIKNIVERLHNYEIDLGIVEGRVNDSTLNTLLMDTDSLVLAVSPGSPLAAQQMVTLLQLKQERLILRLPSSGTRNLFVAQLEAIGQSIDDFNVILEVDNIATIKDLIRRDFGVSILPRSVCLDELKKGKIAVLPVENLSMMREINLVYKKDFGHDEVLRDLLRVYRETVRLYN